MKQRVEQWRYIPLIEANGAIQMAIDEWLLEQYRLGEQPAVLRFYTWSPVAISLGYHQHRYPEFWQQLMWQGEPIELVRRPSGGRAVLHQGDLTYAVITSGHGQRMQAYQQICQFLIEGWRSIGVELHYGAAERGYIHNPNCFGTATGADLVTLDGVKVIGSAQLRRDRAILQHGSIQLHPDPELFQQVFGVPLQFNDFSKNTFPLGDAPASGTPLMKGGRGDQSSVNMLIEALLAAARRCFGIELIEQPLSDREWQVIGDRAAQKSPTNSVLRSGRSVQSEPDPG